MAVPGESSEPGGGSSAEKRFEVGALPTFETLTIFDETRALLYGSLHQVEVTEGNIDEVSAEMGDYIMDASTAFGEVGARLAMSQSEEDWQSILAALWNKDDEERMTLFQSQTDCDDCFTDGNYDEILNNIRKAYLQAEHAGEDLENVLEDAYMHVAAQEVGSLLGHLAMGNDAYHEQNVIITPVPFDAKEKVETTVITAPLVAEKVIGHTLDVAKIALGASIALWVHRKYFGRG